MDLTDVIAKLDIIIDLLIWGLRCLAMIAGILLFRFVSLRSVI